MFPSAYTRYLSVTHYNLYLKIESLNPKRAVWPASSAVLFATTGLRTTAIYRGREQRERQSQSTQNETKLNTQLHTPLARPPNVDLTPLGNKSGDNLSVYDTLYTGHRTTTQVLACRMQRITGRHTEHRLEREREQPTPQRPGLSPYTVYVLYRIASSPPYFTWFLTWWADLCPWPFAPLLPPAL